MKTLICLILLGVLAGCLTFPKDEARANAKAQRDKGYEGRARRFEEKSKYEPKTQLTIGPDEYDPQNNPYFYPELQSKRDHAYNIHFSTPPNAQSKED
jgi:hypothetical protein